MFINDYGIIKRGFVASLEPAEIGILFEFTSSIVGGG
jgi:hypothetical protein